MTTPQVGLEACLVRTLKFLHSVEDGSYLTAHRAHRHISATRDIEETLYLTYKRRRDVLAFRSQHDAPPESEWDDELWLMFRIQYPEPRP